jgi:hypothetical protein
MVTGIGYTVFIIKDSAKEWHNLSHDNLYLGYSGDIFLSRR